MLETLDYEVNTPLPHHFMGNALISCNDLNQQTRDKVIFTSLIFSKQLWHNLHSFESNFSGLALDGS